MQKKKSSYDAKKEKLLSIKNKLENYYDINTQKELHGKNQKELHAKIIMMELTLALIWEIVKDEKAK